VDAERDGVNYAVRRATVGDLDQLAAFFVKAYGPQTVFRIERFISWLYADGDDLNSVIAVADDGSIAGHYGWMPTTLIGRGANLPHAWGVNAFTLPEARGHGLGSALVNAFTKVRPSVGVLGFNDEIAAFYDANGFNIFGGEMFSRHVLPLSIEIRDVLPLVGTTDDPAAERLLSPARIQTTQHCQTTQPSSWLDEPVDSLAGYLTPQRSQRWLTWRYGTDSRLSYTVEAHESTALGRALIAYRAIALQPTEHRITKVVDLYGDVPAAIALMDRVSHQASESGHLYVDFWSFGGPYSEGLEDLSFRRFDGQDVTALPTLTDPIDRRPNTEHVCLFRAVLGDWETLTPNDVYFTSALADRDRPARA
jgi:GNAT superfamily N-acetyltransferase